MNLARLFMWPLDSLGSLLAYVLSDPSLGIGTGFDSKRAKGSPNCRFLAQLATCAIGCKMPGLQGGGGLAGTWVDAVSVMALPCAAL